MPRAIHKLTDMKVRNASKPGYLGDGGGLYLQVSRYGTKSWTFRYQLNGRPREMGLGSVNTFSLKEARQRAQEHRKLLADGIDPIESRNADRQRKLLEAARAKTFDQCAAAYIDAHRAGWRNAKHADQWSNTLTAYASPVFGDLPVADVDTAAVMRVLGSLWNDKTETASRLRGRIESVLNWAAVQGFRTGENPARWRGHLDKLLPKRSKVQKVQHHPALPYPEAPAFMAKLRAQEGIAARALEFLILTAARTGEVIGAKWGEFDMEAQVWTVPAERMKAGRPHEVPLSPRAFALIQAQAAVKVGDYVFPGRRPRDPLSNMALLALLKRMDRSDLTAHGFRSTFRDWVAEQTSFPGEVAEMALAHVVSDKTEAAYRRGTMKEKRQQLMDEWASYCVSASDAGSVASKRKRGRPPTSEHELERLARRASALAAFEPKREDRARSLINGVYVRIAAEESKTPSAIEKAVGKYKRSHPEPTGDELAEALKPWLDDA